MNDGVTILAHYWVDKNRNEGCVSTLSEKQEDAGKKLKGFSSMYLNYTEKRYANKELHLLVVAKALEHFRNFMFWKPVKKYSPTISQNFRKIERIEQTVHA